MIILNKTMKTAANYKFSKYSRSGFTLIEALTALVIVGFTCGTVLVVINDSVDSISDQSSRLEAIEVARENMESMTSQTVLKEFAETGLSELYPNIEWTKTVVVTPFPGASRLWLMATSTANFYNSENELEEVKFESWLAPLTPQQEKLVMQDKQLEQKYLAELEQQKSAEQELEQEQTDGSSRPQQDTNTQSPLNIPGLEKILEGRR